MATKIPPAAAPRERNLFAADRVPCANGILGWRMGAGNFRIAKLPTSPLVIPGRAPWHELWGAIAPLRIHTL
jgi:hypothetical protein